MRKAIEAQTVLDRASWKFSNDTTETLSGDFVRDYPPKEHAEMVVRRDGDRVDINGYRIFFDQWQKRSYNFRALTSGDYFIYYQYPRNQQSPRSGSITKSQRRDFFEKHAGGPQNGAPLDSYLVQMGGKRIAANLLVTPDLRVRGQETIGGTPCQIVAGHTPYGQAALWIAPSKDHCCLKFTVERTGNDLLHDKTISQLSKIAVKAGSNARPIVRILSTLDDVRVDEVDGHYLPVEGRYTESYFGKGGTRVKIMIYRRFDIQLNPTFSDLDAFKVDLPEKSRVNYVDAGKSGVAYEWSNGKVSPITNEFYQSNIDAFKSSRSRFRIMLLLNVIVFAVIGLWLYIRQKRQKNENKE